jgi:hypothetical protein
MSPDPFLNVPLQIQINAAAAIMSVCLDPFALYGNRGSLIH